SRLRKDAAPAREPRVVPSDRERRAAELFRAALERADGDERTAFVNEQCEGNDALRREVESLLAADAAAASGFLEPTPQPRPAGPAGGRLAGARIGRCRIRRLIAAGGMGAVYEATQENPHRTVAVKIMKPGIASRSAASSTRRRSSHASVTPASRRSSRPES